jgi:hypothetical protein
MDKFEHPEDYPRESKTKLDHPKNHCSTSLILGGGLRRTQLACHTHDLPHNPEYKVNPQVNYI